MVRRFLASGNAVTVAIAIRFRQIQNRNTIAITITKAASNGGFIGAKARTNPGTATEANCESRTSLSFCFYFAYLVVNSSPLAYLYYLTVIQKSESYKCWNCLCKFPEGLTVFRCAWCIYKHHVCVSCVQFVAIVAIHHVYNVHEISSRSKVYKIY